MALAHATLALIGAGLLWRANQKMSGNTREQAEAYDAAIRFHVAENAKADLGAPSQFDPPYLHALALFDASLRSCQATGREIADLREVGQQIQKVGIRKLLESTGENDV